MDTTAEDLDFFYRNLFPAEQIFAWTQHGSQDPKENAKREYSITLSNIENRDGVFVRYNACITSQRFRELLYTRKNSAHVSWISKLDIGPKFNGDVTRHKEKTLQPEEKELVFDIDMDEYNSVRTCCQDKKVCAACFVFLSAAAKILHHQLTDTFGFKHILFVFSGRRGIHCWISDYEARILTTRQREGLASYLHSGLQENKKLPLALLQHPVLQSAYEILEPDFVNLFTTQNFFDSEVKRQGLIQAYFDNPSQMLDYHQGKKASEITPKIAWDLLKKHAARRGHMNGIYRIVLDYLYPRLDIEVSKQFNHLLKSPFCIHPATGKVCVPIPYDQIDTFNPDKAPLLSQIIEEYNTVTNGGKNMTKVPQFKNHTELPKYMNPVPPTGVLATKLGPYVEFFTQFVAGVVKDELQRKAQERDHLQAMGNDW